MRPDDLLTTVADPNDPWGSTRQNLRRELVQSIVEGNVEGDLVELADAVIRLAHREFEGYATQGNDLHDDADADLLLRACRTACKRVGVDFPDLPFRDFSTFGKYWRREGMTGGGSWAIRRDYLDGLFEPAEDQLLKLMSRAVGDGLAVAVSPRSTTGWAVIDQEIRELRQRFEVARSDQDHSAVGTACVRILEHLGEVSFDPVAHLAHGEPEPPRDRTKARFDLIITSELAGPQQELVRKLARAAVELAHEVKHRPTPARRDAGIAADAVILLSNIMRRIVNDANSGGPDGAA